MSYSTGTAMKSRLSAFSVLWLCIAAPALFAAEITVASGDGTLAAAITGAASGDTLVLQDGGYSGAVVVDKSLTIRAQRRATDAVVSGGMTIQGEGIEVMVQGLIFLGTLTLNQAAAIRVVENVWLAGTIDPNLYKTSEGDGSLLIVGNRIISGSISNIYSDGAYLAGNVLLAGQISSQRSAWIVGNEIHSSGSAIFAGGTGEVVRIIGNRVFCGNGALNHYQCIRGQTAAGLIANNIIWVDGTRSATYDRTGIYMSSGFPSVLNNVVVGSPPVYQGAGMWILTPTGEVSGNIIVDFAQGPAISGYTSTSDFSDASYNLCFGDDTTCPAGNGNLNLDPQFVDLIDFRLSPTSPAINAGPPDYHLADVDRTRNDIGVYGGPWSIGQFDVQRDPDNFAPFVYPMFKAETAFSGGVLDMQAIGVARLR